jgi:hypothetical protein
MPSFDHELVVELFRAAPDVVTTLLAALAVPFPRDATADVVDRAFGELTLSELHADLVVVLRVEGTAVLVVILEVQRAVDADKDYTWPLYAAAARRQHRCGAVVLVITQEPAVVRRTTEAISLGPGNTFRVFVVGPDRVPIPTPEQAAERPERAVLAALAHARSKDAVELAHRALIAASALDEDHVRLYFDRILDALGEDDRLTLETRMSIGKIEYKSEFARRYYGAGLADGEARGEARRRRGVAARRRGEARGEARVAGTRRRARRRSGEGRRRSHRAPRREVVVSEDERARIHACADLDRLEALAPARRPRDERDRALRGALTLTRVPPSGLRRTRSAGARRQRGVDGSSEQVKDDAITRAGHEEDPLRLGLRQAPPQQLRVDGPQDHVHEPEGRRVAHGHEHCVEPHREEERQHLLVRVRHRAIGREHAPILTKIAVEHLAARRILRLQRVLRAALE